MAGDNHGGKMQEEPQAQEGLERIFARVFEGMMGEGLLKRRDPHLLALIYTAPISALIIQRDRRPERATKLG